jgi:cytochrome P450
MAAAPNDLPPGPRTPSAWQLLQYTFRPLQFLENCARRYGDPFTVRWPGYGTFVMLSDPEAVKDVFRGDARALHSGEGNEFLAETVGKNSVLVLDEEFHARQRRVLLPPLKGERMRAFFEAMQSATLDAINALPIGQPIRMLEPMQDITLRVMLQVVLGLTRGPKLDEFARLVTDVLKYTRGRYSLILVKVLPLGLLRRIPRMPYYRQMRVLEHALFALIAERRRLPAADRGDNILTDLLAETHEDGQRLSDREIRDAVVTLIIAGHDTTSIALAWALEQIVPRADVVQRIVDEVRKVTGGEPPRAEHLTRLEYLDAAIRESLRVRSMLPFVTRVTKRPFVAAGQSYPAGIALCPCSHLVHHRADLYPEPEKFSPERFLERRYAAHEWFPFGGGNRMCLGMTFALYEMQVVLSTLFSHVRLERPPGICSTPVRRGVALAPHDGAMMTVAERL